MSVAEHNTQWSLLKCTIQILEYWKQGNQLIIFEINTLQQRFTNSCKKCAEVQNNRLLFFDIAMNNDKQ